MCLEKLNMLLPLTFDLDQSEKYVLSIRISPGGFMFSMSEPGNRKNYSLQDTEFLPGTSLMDNVKKLVFDLNYLTLQYKETNVIVVTPEYDLIPDTYFSKSEQNDVYKFVHNDQVGHIMHDFNKSQGNYTIYNVEKEMYEFLSRNLCNPQFYSHINLLIDYFDIQHKDDNETSKMYLYFHDKIMDVLCYEGTKLIHSMSYNDRSYLNQAYYVLKIWEMCNFNQLDGILYLGGEVDNSLILMFQKYIKTIERTGPFSEVYLWHEDAQKAPLDLLALSI